MPEEDADRVRAFAAIPLSEATRERLARVAREVAARARSLRPSAPATLHLTLRFLGDIPAAGVAEAAEVLRAAVLGREPFTLGLVGVGVFPNPRRPRVLWVGLEESRELAGLAADVHAALDGLALDDKPFRAHVTIGRFRSPEGGRGLGELLTAYEGQRFAEAEVSRVVLFESRLGHHGVEHRELESWPLVARAAT